MKRASKLLLSTLRYRNFSHFASSQIYLKEKLDKTKNIKKKKEKTDQFQVVLFKIVNLDLTFYIILYFSVFNWYVPSN